MSSYPTYNRWKVCRSCLRSSDGFPSSVFLSDRMEGCVLCASRGKKTSIICSREGNSVPLLLLVSICRRCTYVLIAHALSLAIKRECRMAWRLFAHFLPIAKMSSSLHWYPLCVPVHVRIVPEICSTYSSTYISQLINKFFRNRKDSRLKCCWFERTENVRIQIFLFNSSPAKNN